MRTLLWAQGFGLALALSMSASLASGWDAEPEDYELYDYLKARNESPTGTNIARLRLEAFKGTKTQASIKELHPLRDPDYEQNRKAIKAGQYYFSNRKIIPGRAGYYQVCYRSRKMVSYDPRGQTKAVAFISSEAFPQKLTQYGYPAGDLQLITLNLSPTDSFTFDREGNLLNESAVLKGKVVADPIWQRGGYEKKVMEVGQRLVKANQIKENIVFFVEKNNKDINAFGSETDNEVRITQGLLLYIENDDELAGVLAHEIAHIILRHSGFRQRIPADDILLYYYTRIPPEQTEDTTEVEYAQQKELDADRFGLRMMARSGYNPEAMVSIIGKISGDGSKVWRTHPAGTIRLAALKRSIQMKQYAETEPPITEPLNQKPKAGPDVVIQGWDMQKAREEVLKYTELTNQLKEDVTSFKAKDPDYQRHSQAIQQKMSPQGRSLVYTKFIEPYAALMKETEHGSAHYAVHYDRVRLYLRYTESGDLKEVVLCNRAAWPRACCAEPYPLRNPSSLILELSEIDGFMFNSRGNFIGYKINGEVYDKTGQLVQVSQLYKNP
jgi:hypothetical protein